MTMHAGTITVSGQTVQSIVAAIQSFSVLVDEIHDCIRVAPGAGGGERRVDVDAWYAIEDYLLAYKKIDTLLGGRGLEKIGSLIPTHAKLPPTVVDVVSALSALDVAFHMNHARDGVVMFDPTTGAMLEGIGHYEATVTPDQNLVHMRCENPYPCRFDLGLVRGMAQRFAPAATADHAAGSCRRKGDPSCTYVVRW